MDKIAIAYLTKDRIELSRRTIEPLLQPDKFDVIWIDGSVTKEGLDLPTGYPVHQIHHGIGGGPDAAVAYALTAMLAARTVGTQKGQAVSAVDGTIPAYDFVGLCESDVLFAPDWFAPTMALFERGKSDGLEVGAVSARAYEDRILCQRDGYALMLNLGWGMQIMTRQAAEIALANFRTHWTLENRRVFAQLTGTDIGSYWAFRAGEHMLCADWGNDAALAANGLASLALTPSPVEMIGQDPPLEKQGLKLATADTHVRENNADFETFVDRTFDIRKGLWQPGWNGPRYRDDAGLTYLFTHQLPGLEDTRFEGEWRLRWSQGFGPFAWRSTQKGDSFETYISGGFDFMVSGGADGGEVEVSDVGSGYVVSPRLPPEATQGMMMHLHVPAQVGYRKVRLIAKDPGISFYGIRCREPQPSRPGWAFDHSALPSV